MIRSEHSIVRYDFDRRRATPDRLRQTTHSHYSAAALRCIEVYASGVGVCRQTLHRRIAAVLQALGDCPPRRIAAFCKLLDDRAEFSDGTDAVRLRRNVFRIAASLHPIVTRREGIFENDLGTARETIERAIGRPWEQIQQDLYADVIELQRLAKFDTPGAATDLLAAYNVAQTQALLYRATAMRIDVTKQWKPILQSAKLAGLMHRIDRLPGDGRGYRFQFDGPGSALRSTSRYGIKFARMIPRLLSCDHWRLAAEVLGPGNRPLRFELSPADRLHSPLPPPPAYDSLLEEEVHRVWQKRPVEHWRMHREAELIVRGQKVFTPDFQLEHDDGRQIFVEVIGFWTPEYLADKASRLQTFCQLGSEQRWLLMFSETIRDDRLSELKRLSLPSITFSARTNPADWIAAALS